MSHKQACTNLCLLAANSGALAKQCCVVLVLSTEPPTNFCNALLISYNSHAVKLMSIRHDVCACTQPGFGPCPRQQVRGVQWNERSIAAIHTVTGASLPALREAMLHHGTRGQPPDVPVTFQLPGSKAVKAVLSDIRRRNGGGAHWSVRQYVLAVGEVGDHRDWLLSQIKVAIPKGYTPAKKVAAIMWSLQAVKRMTDKPHGLVDLLLGKSYRIDTGVMSSKRCKHWHPTCCSPPFTLCSHLVGIEAGVAGRQIPVIPPYYRRPQSGQEWHKMYYDTVPQLSMLNPPLSGQEWHKMYYNAVPLVY